MELHLIRSALDVHSQNFHILLNRKKSEGVHPADGLLVPKMELLPEDDGLEEVLRLTPIKNMDDLTSLETILQDDEIYENYIRKLSSLGGYDFKQFIRKIMNTVFSDEVANVYSWEGKKKRKFKDLTLANVILTAARSNMITQHCSEEEILLTIKRWLVKAKERLLSKTMRLTKDETHV